MLEQWQLQEILGELRHGHDRSQNHQQSSPVLLTATETSPPMPFPTPQRKTSSREGSSSLLSPTAETPSSNRTNEADLIPAHSVTDMSPQRDAAGTHVLPCRIGPAPIGATPAKIPEEPL